MKAHRGSDTRYLLGLAVGALGVVYGDIGTSPLYALHECFGSTHSVPPSRDNILGVLSLVFWSLIILVSIKYLSLVLRADNKGEGGILALLALAFPEHRSSGLPRMARLMLIVGLFGTALLYGDGMITPAISVLSAVEGLNVATNVLEPYIVPITVVILIGLFSVQKFGTGRVGNVFGRVTLLWFVVMAVLGVRGIIGAPEVLAGLNPYYGIRFLVHNGWPAFVVLGAVFLVMTGTEALYADMGHFGRRAIQTAWFCVVLPALVLNYFGQGAMLLKTPEAAVNPFYLLAPRWALYPLVVLATTAAVIASQALISGAFSLTLQATQLGYFPRLRVEHTSSMERGQIYIADVNWFLMLACIGLVIGFGSSSNLAAAYGLAVILTMVITTTLLFFATQRLWNWSRTRAALVCLPFLLIELAYLAANSVKIKHGGWFPLVVALLIFTLLSTWKTGRKILAERLERTTLPLDLFFEDLVANPLPRVKGTAIFLSGRAGTAPISLLHNLKHNKVLHQRVIILTIVAHEQSHVDGDKRLEVEPLREGFYRVVGHYGFMESPDVPALLDTCSLKGLQLNRDEFSYFLSKETVIPIRGRGMALWREKLFSVMSRNATSAASFFKLPPNKVVELGMQIEL